MEAVFQQMEGVKSVESGYSGGTTENPTYEEVCRGDTGHAEVVRVEFDPSKTSYEAVLREFFRSHDPTQVNRQGADVGTQYRSVVFFDSDEEKATAERIIKEVNDSGKHDAPVATVLTKLDRYWPGEKYHQNYYRTHPQQGYCKAVIGPKLVKLGLDA